MEAFSSGPTIEYSGLCPNHWPCTLVPWKTGWRLSTFVLRLVGGHRASDGTVRAEQELALAEAVEGELALPLPGKNDVDLHHRKSHFVVAQLWA